MGGSITSTASFPKLLRQSRMEQWPKIRGATPLDYDKSRQAIGVEVILGALTVGTGKSSKDLHILDAGCGTGNYLVAVSMFVGKITGVDCNEGMVKQAKQKTAHLDNVQVHIGNVLSLPFSDQQFDGVICDQVIQHLQPKGSSGFANVGTFLNEVHRVLKPKGAVIINTCTPEQGATANWFLQLISEHLQKEYEIMFPSVLQLQRLMQDVGFTASPVLCHNRENYYKPEMLYDQEGPFQQEWRNRDGSWSVPTPEELEKKLGCWRKMIDEGKADKFIQKCEEHRMRIGCATSVIGYK